MAQPLTPISLIGPGFQGVNTESSPISDDYTFAIEANNAVIDKYGRLSARKGFKTLTTSGLTDLGGNPIESMGRYVSDLENHNILSAGNGNIFIGTSTLTTLTTSAWKTTNSYTITATDNLWDFVPFRGQTFMFQKGYEPLVYDETNGLVKISSDSNYQTPVTGPTLNDLKSGTACGAYGRVWVGSGSTVYWSNLLVGADFETGDSGAIDILEYFPNGYDQIVSIQAHNGFLIIFGRESIVVYSGADGDPATNLKLQDTVAGVSCLSNASVATIGTDLLYMSTKGLKSFGRTIQEKSMPLEDLSLSVKSDLLTLLRLESNLSGKLQAVYSPEDYFYLITFVNSAQTYCFDVRQRTEQGSFRVTVWPSSIPKCWTLDNDFNLLCGGVGGIYEYSGYHDNTQDTYEMTYVSPWLGLGQPQIQKFIKTIKPTLSVEGAPSFQTGWAYDLKGSYKTSSKNLSSLVQLPAQFNVDEFNTTAEYGTGSAIVKYRVNTNGSGSLIGIKGSVTIDGGAVSIQEIQVQTLLGKVY